MAASLQLIAVLPHTPLSLEPQEPLLELDQTEHPVRQAILARPLDAERGVMQIPPGPGLGIEIDRAGLQRFRVGGSA